MNSTKRNLYPWVVCFFCTLMMFSAVGMTSSAFGVHLPYIIEYTGCTNAQCSLINSFKTITVVVSMMFADAYYKKLSVRKGVFVAGMLTALGFILFACSKSIGMFYFGSMFLGVGAGIAGIVPISIIINNWFLKHRGLALGISVTGSGFALMGLPSLLATIIDRFGLQLSFLVEGLIVIICFVLIFIFVSDTPEEKGMKAFGFGEDISSVQKYSNLKSLPDGQRFSKGMMALSLVMQGLIGISSLSCTYISLLYTSTGYSDKQAGFYFAAIGLTLTVGKLIAGAVADRYGNSRGCDFSFAFMFVGMILFCMAGMHNNVINILCVIFAGIGLTLTTLTLQYTAMACATKEKFGRVLQFYEVTYFGGYFLVCPLTGKMADISGNYVPVYMLLTSLVVMAYILKLILYKYLKKQSM